MTSFQYQRLHGKRSKNQPDTNRFQQRSSLRKNTLVCWMPSNISVIATEKKTRRTEGQTVLKHSESLPEKWVNSKSFWALHVSAEFHSLQGIVITIFSSPNNSSSWKIGETFFIECRSNAIDNCKTWAYSSWLHTNRHQSIFVLATFHSNETI